jgi:hypothetical protein
MGSGGGDAAGAALGALAAGASLAAVATAAPGVAATAELDEAGEVPAGEASGVAAPLPPQAVSAKRRKEARRMAHCARSSPGQAGATDATGRKPLARRLS